MLEPWLFTFLGYRARILHPEYFLLGVAVAVMLVLFGLAFFRRVERTRRTVPKRLREKVLPGWSPFREGTRLSLVGMSLLLFAVSLTQPQCGTGTELARRMGIDVVVALDVSRSMLARDVRPSRIERARLELMDLIDQLDGDRFGLVVFAGTAFPQCPLTTDYAAAKLFLRAVDPSAMPVQGTNLAGALRKSGELLASREGARSQVIVLLTDGEDHSQHALAEAEALASRDIRVFTVGIGSPTGEPIPLLSEDGKMLGYKKDKAGNTILSRLDEATLQQIADETGGQYVHAATSGAGVQEVIEVLAELEESELESRMTTRYSDRSVVFLFPGLLFLLAGTLLRPSRGTRRPRPEGRPKKETGKAAGSKAAALVLLLVSPGLTGAGLLEAEHPDVARGNEAYAEGDYAGAVAAYDEALGELEDGTDRARVEYNRGTALAAAGQMEAAREAFKAGLADAPDDLQSRDWYNLGTGLLKTGDAKGAVEALAHSLRLDGGNKAAKYNLELALRQMQQQKDQQQQSDEGESKDEPSDEESEPQKGDDGEQGEKDQQDGESQQDESDKGQDDAEEEQADDEGEQSQDDGDGSDQEGGEQAKKDGDAEEKDEAGEKPGDEKGEGQDELAEKPPEAGETGDEGEKPGETPDDAKAEAGEQPGQSGKPEDAEAGDGEGEKALADAAPTEVSEQEADKLLEALAQGEKPLQMQLFQVEDYDEKASEQEEDW